MGSRYEVELTVGSAKDLKNVNWRNGDLKPYAVLWIDGGAKCSTRVDLDNGENPAWDEKVVVPLPPTSRIQDAVLYIDVVHANAAEGTKPLVGSARLPLRDVVDDAGIGGRASRNLRLKRPSGRPQGRLDVRVAVKEPSRYYDPNPGYPAPTGIAVGAAAGVLGGLALAGGASYVENKFEERVAEKVEEDSYGGGYGDYGGDDDY